MYMKNTNKQISLCLCLLIVGLLCVTGCSKKDATTPNVNTDKSTAGNIPGMGGTSGDLTGKEFHFPTAVEITGGIKGDLFVGPQSGYCQKLGCGAFVLLQFNFVNKTGKDTILVFPAGLTFHSQDIEDQNGIILQDIAIALNKGASCKTMIYSFCINEHRHASDVTSIYRFGPITNAAPMVELLDLLKNKNINLKAGEQPDIMGRVGSLQTMVWNLTEGNGLTDLDRDNIGKLENK